MRRLVSRRRYSMMMLSRRQVVDDLNELLRAAGLGDVGGVLPVDDDEGNALDLVALGELLGALQVRVHGEGVICLRIVLRADPVVFSEALLELQGLVIVLGDEGLVLLLNG